MDESASLDPVASSETLGRFCRPDQWDQDKLRPDAIQLDDLTKTERGWSVQRVERTSRTLAIECANQIPQIDATTASVALVDTSDVRGVRAPDGYQAFVVMENSLADNPAHALVFLQVTLGKGQLRLLRDRLISLIRRADMNVFRSTASC